MLRVISVLENPSLLPRAIAFFQKHWANEDSAPVYTDCLSHSAPPMNQWYLLMDGDAIIGGAGLIANDFISRQDLYPWLCALVIEEAHRGHGHGALLIARCKADARAAGFPRLYLSSDHVGYYEKYGFVRIATGHHPWGESSGIFAITL
ncbi:MAG: GNAT family N-acetyltransferase [Oscillospiraceae bacterium]|jgi:GNAT superfamily N-acetyltransferase|nr:GNAT family N-acetyltransferase [Oscillospiraceae bacterium]